jgi:hypothetical protein
MQAPGRVFPKGGLTTPIPGPVQFVLALSLLAASFSISPAAARTVIQLEAEDAYSWYNAGGDPIEPVVCASARNTMGMEGLDYPGDYVEWLLVLPEGLTFRDSLRSAGAIGLVRQFIVEFLYALESSQPRDTLTTPPGSGVWCTDAIYDCVQSSKPLQLSAGVYVLRLTRTGASGRTRVDFLDLGEELSTTDVGEAPETRLALRPPRPNPASRTVELDFSLASSADAVLEVYDVAGRLLVTLLSGTTAAGRHRLPWDLCDERKERVQAGVYFARLTAAGASGVRRIVVMP